MPVPLIAVGVVAFSALVSTSIRVGASRHLEGLQVRYDLAINRYERRLRASEASRLRLVRRYEQLLGRKRHAHWLLSETARFLGRARVRDREFAAHEQITIEQLELRELPTMSNVGAALGLAGSTASGAATAGAAWAAMGAWGSASTGTAISTLSGAAAHNSILAWFGGGSLATGGGGMLLGSFTLGGIAAVPLLLDGARTFASAAEATTEYERAMAQADIASARLVELKTRMNAAAKSVEESMVVGDKLATALQDVLSHASPDDPRQCHLAFLAAKALADWIDSPDPCAELKLDKGEK